MTLAEWIRRQCNATIEGSTIAAMVGHEISARFAAAGFGNPPPPARVLLGDRPGALLPIREGVGHRILKNLADENSRKVGEASKPLRAEPPKTAGSHQRN